MRHLLTAATYFATLVIVAAAALVAVLFLAGPHAGLLPQPLEIAVIATAWLAVLFVPVLVARKVWRRGATPRA